MRRIVACLALAVAVSGSAIPMWEFLSRGEKMSHLFNMFVKQVEDHCEQTAMPDCNKVLMVYGLTNLAKMDDDSLDKMDPYQRGAQDIIWNSMMKGSYKSPSSGDSNSSSDTTSSSSRRTALENNQQDIYPSEPEFSDGGNSLGSQDGSQPPDDVGRYLIGPMAVRVMPDGSPVPGDVQRPLPRDEDAEEFRLLRAKPLPSLEEIQRGRTSPRYQHYPRYPQLSASQPHAKFALPPPGLNLRIAPPLHPHHMRGTPA